MDPDKDALMSSFVNIMDKDKKWYRRWLTAHSDFVVYIYKKPKVGCFQVFLCLFFLFKQPANEFISPKPKSSKRPVGQFELYTK